MNQKIIVADDFYEIAHPYHKSFSENQCLITDETIHNLSAILNRKIEIIDAFNDVLMENTKDQITANTQADWIAVIYLTLPPDCVFKKGMSFYTHMKTKLDHFPDNYAMELYGWKTMEDLEKSFNVCDKNDWNEYMNIFVKYNRIVLFQANYWHSYGVGFGNDLNTSMLYQKILIKNV
jgi:hypothetical protein